MSIRAFAASCVMAAAVALSAGAANAAKVATTDENLEGTIRIEQRVRLPQGGASARIHVELGLKNLSNEDLIINAPGQCAVHKYAIVHPNNDPIVVKAPKECVGGPVSLTIPAGETIREGATMQVQGGLLETGRRYYVIYEFWGVKIRSPFRILDDQ